MILFRRKDKIICLQYTQRLSSKTKLPMENLQLQCKLCGGSVTDDNFRGIDEDIERIFNVLLLTLSSDKDIHYVLCEVCSTKLFAAFNFKSTCLHMDNSIKLYVDSGNPAPVDLKKIYAKQKGKKQGEICRFCFQPMVVKSEQKSIQEVPRDRIQIYIPEINFALTSKPAICLNCFDSLHVHSTFVKNCLDMEEKKKINGTLSNPCVKTEDLDIEFEEAKEGEMPFLDSDVKKEEVEEGVRTRYIQIQKPILQDINIYNAAMGSIVKNDIPCTSNQSIMKSFHVQVETEEVDVKTERNTFEENHEERTLGIKNPAICIKCNVSPCIHNDFIRNHCDMEGNVNETFTNSIIKTEEIEIKYEEINEEELPVPNCYSGIKKQDNREGGYFNRVAESIKTESEDAEQVENNVLDNDRCSYESSKKRNLTAHKLRHEKGRSVQQHKCDVCGLQMRYKRDLNRHQLKHKDPSEVRMYKCDVCAFEVRYKRYLKRHQLRHRDPSEIRKSEVRMYKCNDCDYKTHEKRYLDSHQLSHKDASELQMYKCEICFYETRYRRALMSHQLKHKDPSETRMFLCDQCAFATKYKHVLKTHQLRHKDP